MKKSFLNIVYQKYRKFISNDFKKFKDYINIHHNIMVLINEEYSSNSA